MICPRCGTGTHVVQTLRTGQGRPRRRRECDSGHRFWTTEVWNEDLAAAAAGLAGLADRVPKRQPTPGVVSGSGPAPPGPGSVATPF